MRTHTFIRPLVAAALTTTAVALAACGGDPAATGEPSAERQAKAQEAQLEFARCMREHGIDMDDPKPGERGIRLAIPDGVSRARVDAAQEACQKYLDAIKPPELSEEQQKDAKEAALAHSRCMREHGIDFPDPQFGENGEATIRIDKRSGIDPEDPKFQQAQEECQKENPGLFGAERDEASP